MSHEPTPREIGLYFALAQVGLEMVLPAVLGVYLDPYYGTTPWITVTLGIIGFAGGLVHLLALVKKKPKDESSDKKPPP
jgi:F0F1-type ATP synthase assembly protein I